MDFLQNKVTQIIALVGIIGTLAGFGYTGATYVNRIDNLEAKIGGVKEADEGLGAIELRIEALETSITFINKTIKCVKKLFLQTFFTSNKLNIINNKY